MSRKSGNRFSEKDMRKIKSLGRIAIQSNRDALYDDSWEERAVANRPSRTTNPDEPDGPARTQE